jgi:hypothetical protein
LSDIGHSRKKTPAMPAFFMVTSSVPAAAVVAAR